MQFIITVDTEADNQWKSQGETKLTNIDAIPRFQELCIKYGFIPTYLVTHEVATSEHAVSVLRPFQERGEAEIGTHLHPWTAPPYFDKTKESELMHFPSELNDEYLQKKFLTLHEAVTQYFGKPTSFRAGRWGFDARVEKLLVENDYVVDCSMTPFINWKRIVKNGNLRNVPDFTHESPEARVLRSGLVEIPMSIYPKEHSLVSRVGARLLGRGSFRVRWCRIFPETSMQDLKAVYISAKKSNNPFLEFMVHSSEFVSGGSPYSKNDAQLQHFFCTFEAYLKYLKDEGVVPATLTQAARTIR